MIHWTGGYRGLKVMVKESVHNNWLETGIFLDDHFYTKKMTNN